MNTESEQWAAERKRIRARERRRSYRRTRKPPYWTILFGLLAWVSFAVAYCAPHHA